MSTAMMNDKFLLSVEEAAAYFHIGEKKIRSMVPGHGGKIAVMDGNRILIKREAMEQFLLECSAI